MAHTELRGALDALEQRKWHPEGPAWARGVGLCKPQEAQQEPEQGATPGSGQAPGSTQAGGWTDGEQPCPEGLGHAGTRGWM